jgi:hypothetical protein
MISFYYCRVINYNMAFGDELLACGFFFLYGIYTA